MTNNRKTTLLCILDGFGIGEEANQFNAIAQAKMTNYQRILANYPHAKIETSGQSVGLPEGQIGNSEVGHMTIGAGRIIYQDLPRINLAIENHTIEENIALKNLIKQFQASDKTCHLAGLMSDGGVHSHIDHIIFLADFLQKNQVKVVIHVFLDGRDVAQKSAEKYLKKISNFKIATISGRYYAMDRDQKWDRIDLAFNAIIDSQGENFEDGFLAIAKSYQNNITDEFIKPCVIGDYQGVKFGDGLIFCNFRADRARQMSERLMNSKKFEIAIAFSEYSQKLNDFYQILFPPIIINKSLPQVLADHGLKQLRIAETEKYAHVTFFFSCGREENFPNEDRILIPSPKVATYDLKPEMSAIEITNNLCKAIESNNYDFILVNYANPDMVGHSGDLNASIQACKVIDQQLAILEKVVLKNNANMLITADHGNIECMIDENNQPHTSHTTNPVPLIFISKQANNFQVSSGGLSDLASSILSIMNIDQPIEMTGKKLINPKQ